MAFTGCSSEPEIAPEMQPIRLELTAGTTTRTEIGPDNKISWSDTGETLKVLEQVGDATFSALDNDGYTKDPTSGKASFSVALPVKTGTSFRYATLHPKAAYVTNSNTNLAAIKFIVPDIQLPTATSGWTVKTARRLQRSLWLPKSTASSMSPSRQPSTRQAENRPSSC